ncbi:MAG: MBL fold metallo-hydrolase [Flavobacteriales bacterium]|jgi:glyoxylase-like metal-dependent hydrolase (beta-lactamase superfamily II)|nr:MBL fold metallo-hydrolase [Flavobacteriales bacterium]
MQIQIFTFNPFQENTYLLFDETKEAVLIDPGCHTEHEYEELVEFIEKNDLKLVKIINTHCHIDHIMGWYFTTEKWGLKPYYHSKEEVWVQGMQEHAKMFGFEMEDFGADYGIHLDEMKSIGFGNTELEIHLCPGHAPGHVVFHHPESKQCIVGDVIFKNSIGRTDLPHCNQQDLVDAIRNTIYSFPDDTVLFPGHGPRTTVGEEKVGNMFVRV